MSRSIEEITQLVDPTVVLDEIDQYSATQLTSFRQLYYSATKLLIYSALIYSANKQLNY